MAEGAVEMYLSVEVLLGKIAFYFSSALLFSALMAQAADGGECSLAKTNLSCTLTIDRRNPLAPPTIQMYPEQTLTVQVKNPYYFERYFMDYQSGQVTLAPDVASSIVGGLLTPLQSGLGHLFLEVRADSCTVESIAGKIPKNGLDITTNNSFYMGCLADFAQKARNIYLELEPAVAPDAHRQGMNAPLPDNPTLQARLTAKVPEITNLYDVEAQLSTAIGIAAKLDKFDPATGFFSLSPDQAKAVRTWVLLSAMSDAVAKDLYGFASRIKDLPTDLVPDRTTCQNAPKPPKGKANVPAVCVKLFPIKDPSFANPKIVTRQVTYAVDALNLVQNSQVAIPDPSKKRAIASVTILYGDSKWEASAGTFFSTLPIRSFSVGPVFTAGKVTDTQIAESVLHPTIVPFAAANYRLTHDLAWTKWRSALYWTGAVGVNPNTVSADFATGLSLSWRGLMFSGLFHVGHGVRLTQGLYTGETLGPDFSGTATTETYWKGAAAFGIAVRVPSLTGR
jgi:hypothetical protein